MGGVCVCCAARPKEEEKPQAEQHEEPQFFDCIENVDDEIRGVVYNTQLVSSLGPYPRSPRKEPRVLKKPSLEDSYKRVELGKEGGILPCCSNRATKEGMSSNPTLVHIVEHVREAWEARMVEHTSSHLEEEFPEITEWTKAPVVERMLRAAGGKQEEATDLLIKAIDCRVRDRELFTSLRCNVLFDIRVIGRDVQQRPTIYFCFGSQKGSLRDIIPQTLLAYEVAARITEPDGQFVLIADMHNFTLSKNLEFSAMRYFCDVVGSVYAERLHFSLIVDFSYVAQTMWSLAKSRMSEVTRNKLCFAGKTKAQKIVRERFQGTTCEWILSSFEINRDQSCSDEDRHLHAQRTSICDVPLGP